MPKQSRKKTALTDPDNIMVVWEDEEKPPAKKAAKRVNRVLGK